MSRDSQRSRVYAWGWAIDARLPVHPLSLAQCEDLISRARAAYGEDPIATIADGRGTRIARGGPRRISLPRWSRTRVHVLHEVAHSLVPRQAPAHGPEFARVLLDLIARFASEIPKRELRRLARVHGVRIGSVGASPAPVAAATARRLLDLGARIRRVEVAQATEHARHERRSAEIRSRLAALHARRREAREAASRRS